MSDQDTQHGEPITRSADAPSRTADGTYKAVIAKNDMGVDLSRMDVSDYVKNPIVLFNHNQNMPVARSTRGPWREDDGSWVAEFQFAKGDRGVDRVRNFWDQDPPILRAASIGFRMSRDERGDYPVLKEWSIVSAGLDSDALARNELDLITRSFDTQRSDDMAETQETRAEEAQDEEQTGSDAPAEQEADAVAGEPESVADEHSDERSADVVTRAEAQGMVDAAMSRQALITRTADVRVGGFDPSNASKRAIIVNALNGKVKDHEQRSEDYLEGRLDEMIEQREVVRNAIRDASQKHGNAGDMQYRDASEIHKRYGGGE